MQAFNSAYETVYKVQCKTYSILLNIWNLPDNLATTPDHPIMLFRLVPAYRCAKSIQLRKMVADKVREIRQQTKQI
jgi:hypothetical protein